MTSVARSPHPIKQAAGRPPRSTVIPPPPAAPPAQAAYLCPEEDTMTSGTAAVSWGDSRIDLFALILAGLAVLDG